MAFTMVPVAGSLTNAAGAALSGSFTFTLAQAIANGGQTLTPSPIQATLDETGALSVTLASTNDQDTVPQGVWYGVTETLTGCQPRDYFISLPGTATETNGSLTDGSDLAQLDSLRAMAWMVGCPIAGTGIPADTTIDAVLQGTNQLKLSAPATASGSALTLTVSPPASVDIADLMPGDTAWL